MHAVSPQPRCEVAIPVTVKPLPANGRLRCFSASSVNVSVNGVALGFYEVDDTIRIISSFLTEDQRIEMTMTVPSTGVSITATGRPRWHSTTSIGGSTQYLKVGILLEEMELEDKIKWLWFLKDAGRATFQDMLA